MGRLQDKVAIITGAARGMGEAMARLFAAEGAKVVLGDLLEAEGRAVAKEIGDAALFVPLDITKDEAWAEIVRQALARFGTIDILINNAAIAPYCPMMETSRADFEKVLQINVVGTFIGMKAVIPTMQGARRGSIVNISSLNAMRGTVGMISYDASKWAIRGITKTTALETAQYGIRCNSVHPGAINTPMLNPDDVLTSEQLSKGFGIPFGRVGVPIEIANAALFLASDEASYVSGAELLVDGAWGAGLATNAQEIIDAT